MWVVCVVGKLAGVFLVRVLARRGKQYIITTPLPFRFPSDLEPDPMFLCFQYLRVYLHAPGKESFLLFSETLGNLHLSFLSLPESLSSILLTSCV